VVDNGGTEYIRR